MTKISLLIFLLVTRIGFAQTTDVSFGRNGASFVNLYDSIPALYTFDHDIDPAGNLYILATFYMGGSLHQSDLDHVILKVNAAGKIDSSFFENGYRSVGHGIINFSTSWPYRYHPPNFVKVSNDQSRIYVFSNSLSLRLRQNGQTDSSYGNNGYVLHPDVFPSREVIMTQDGGFIFISTQQLTQPGPVNNIALNKYTASGQPDISFNGNGKLTVQINGTYTHSSSILLSGDNIVLSGVIKNNGSFQYDSIALIKIKSNGKVDSSFGLNGIGKSGLGFSDYSDDSKYTERTILLPDSSYEIIKAADFNGGGTLTQFKFTRSGAVDNSFGTNGKIFNQFFLYKGDRFLGRYKDPTSLSLWMTKKIWNIGDSACYAMLKLKPNGHLDSSFYKTSRTISFIEANGFAQFNQHSLVFDEKLINPHPVGITGISNNTTLRTGKLKTNGAYDSTYGVNGKAFIRTPVSIDQLVSLIPLKNNKMAGLSSDYFDFFIFRLGSNGNKDSSFGINGVVRMNGLLNNPPSFSEITNGHLAADNNDRILTFLQKNSNPNYPVVVNRYKLNGTPDSSFGVNGRFELSDPNFLTFEKGLVQYDNKVLLLVRTNQPAPRGQDITIIRLNENGTLDNTFGFNGSTNIDFISDFTNPSSGLTDLPQNMLVLKDSGIIVTGSYVDGNSQFLVKLNKNGQILRTGGAFGRHPIEGNNESNTFFLAEADSGKVLISFDKRFNGSYQFTGVYRLKKDFKWDSTYTFTTYYNIALPPTPHTFRCGQLLNNGKLFLGGIRYENNKHKAILVVIKPNGGIDSTAGAQGVISFPQFLRDTATVTVPLDLYQSHDGYTRVSVFRDSSGQLITSTTVKRNRLRDIFITRNMVNDIPNNGKLTLWTKQLCPASNKVLIKINNLTDSLTTALSTEPLCNAIGALTLILPPGVYQIKSFCGNDSASTSVTIISDSCVKKEIVANIVVTSVTNINQSELFFRVMPNPVDNVLSVVLDRPDVGSIKIIDINGKEIGHTSFTGSTISLDMSTYPSGSYIVYVKGKRKIGKKLIVKTN